MSFLIGRCNQYIAVIARMILSLFSCIVVEEFVLNFVSVWQV